MEEILYLHCFRVEIHSVKPKFFSVHDATVFIHLGLIFFIFSANSVYMYGKQYCSLLYKNEKLQEYLPVINEEKHLL